MRKIALALMAASAAVFGLGMVTSAAGYDAALDIDENPTAGGSYTVTYENCFVGDTITFTQPESTPTSVTGECIAPLLLEGPASVIGFLMPQAPPTYGMASATFTNAPPTGGTLTVTAVGLQSPELDLQITVQVPTTTAAPTTTVAATTPDAGLPATGSNGVGTMTGIAIGLFAVGLGLFVVAQVRRRQASATV